MPLNLHATVRGAIQSVNPDITAAYLQSDGFIIAGDGSQIPTYDSPVPVQIQVQPPSGRDLAKINFLNLQGVIRSIYLYGWPQGVNRVNVQGGDLFMFPQTPGGPLDNWLVAYVDENWQPDTVGWTKLVAVLQTDGRLILINNSFPVLNSDGTLEYTGT